LKAITGPAGARILSGRAQVRAAPAARIARNRSAIIGAAVLTVIAAIGLLAPFLGTTDPTEINPTYRNQPPGFQRTIRTVSGVETRFTYWMGTDSLGRDVFSRTLFGTRVSLIVGLSVASISVTAGLIFGTLAGYVRWLDGPLMRIMDGLMAVPPILLAISLVSLASAGLRTVIVAIVIPEIPRAARLVRSVVLSIREEMYVEAAVALGARLPSLLLRHVLPNTIGPMIVQATYVCASAILVEAILSFLGIGVPTSIPTWGNIMAEGRTLFRLFPHTVLFPGAFLALTVLAVNMLGDGLRDMLDPHTRTRF
jgi:peptide/nickel transport system permease protein